MSDTAIYSGRISPETCGDISDRALKLIGSSEDGLFQYELRKMLDVDSSRCSKIVAKILKMALIRRESAFVNGTKTYILKLVEMPAPQKRFPLPQRPPIPQRSSVSQRSPVSQKQPIYRRPSRPQKPSSYQNIDKYLAEIYLLYLIRFAEN
jgi:hypothetical protein